MFEPFTVEEIKLAVFGCNSLKSLGLHGFSMAFYQENWSLVKEDLVKVFQEFYGRGILNSSMLESYVCLIPKKESVIRVKDFRPISLITSMYKILAKVLANRLKRVLSSTISEEQGAFVVGANFGPNPCYQ